MSTSRARDESFALTAPQKAPAYLGAAILYYGGKAASSRYYPEPLHETIVEPFAGGAGYALRWWDRDVVLVEKYEVLADVWRYLIHEPPEKILSLPMIGDEQTVDDFDISPTEKHLIGFWLNAGVSAPVKSPSRWMKENRSTRKGSWWTAENRERLARLSECVSHWTVVCGDYTRAPDIEATWFIDPPYQVAGKHYKNGSSGVDYPDLGDWCQNRLGQVIVCENVGADWLPFRPFRKTVAAASRTGRKHSSEAIWTKGCGGYWGKPPGD